jgi:putative transcriptional regulator
LTYEKYGLYYNYSNVKLPLHRRWFSLKNCLRDLRGNFNLTQEQLADLLGISRQSVISIENGRYDPSLTLSFKIAKVFHCRIEDIFIYEEIEEDGNE